MCFFPSGIYISIRGQWFARFYVSRKALFRGQWCSSASMSNQNIRDPMLSSLKRVVHAVSDPKNTTRARLNENRIAKYRGQSDYPMAAPPDARRRLLSGGVLAGEPIRRRDLPAAPEMIRTRYTASRPGPARGDPAERAILLINVPSAPLLSP
jgi:hypothetical protein